MLFVCGIAVLALLLFVALPSYQLASATLSLSRALDGAQSVTVTEFVQYFDTSGRDLERRDRLLSTISPSAEQVREFQRAIGGVITVGSPLSHKRCFDPHHRVDVVRGDGSSVRLDICFQCDNFQLGDGAIETMPRPWLQRLPKFFSSIGLPVRSREEYAKLNPNNT